MSNRLTPMPDDPRAAAEGAFEDANDWFDSCDDEHHDAFCGGYAAGVAAKEAENARLRAALERTLHNFEAVLARTPVRDAAETIAEARRALGGAPDV